MPALTIDAYLQNLCTEQQLMEATYTMLVAQQVPAMAKEENGVNKYHYENLRSPVGALISKEAYHPRIEGVSPANLIPCLDAYMKAETEADRNRVTFKGVFLDELESAHIKAAIKWKESKFDNAVYKNELQENYAILKEAFTNPSTFHYGEYHKNYAENKLKFKKTFQVERDAVKEATKKSFMDSENKQDKFSLTPLS